ncbi:MAG TPA: OmpH family outer membrane protein [Thermoanaerobaculia bacterium]|nr:OmpH family outer membrane protein [Thermoanaerobaculia bacterium]
MKKFIVTVAMAALSVPAFAQTAPARVAVVDVQKVLTQSAPGKAAYERLRKMQEDRITKAKQMDDELKKLDSDIAAKRVSLSEDKLAEMAKQLSDKKIAMQRYAQDADREIGEARDKELQALQIKIEPVINGIGKEMGLAVIFNKFESGLVYAADAVDITDTVVKRFNDAVAAAPATAAKK